MTDKHEDSEDKGGKWLTTFNDMVTLLLTFMVLVLSLSKLDAPKLAKVSYSMRAIFSLSERGKEAEVKVFTPFVIPVRSRALKFERDKRELAERINKAARIIAKATRDGASAGPEGIVNAKVIKEGISITIGEKLLFETGMAEIEKRNQPALNALCPILKETVCQIRIEGHADDVPINNERFPSNWELSVARAVNVVKYFISQGGILPERLSAAGYADSRPLFSNVSDHNRDINRRVEVILALKKG
jgi:chemotaxis protein MotB